MGCEHPAELDDLEDDDGNVKLVFSASDATRSGLADYFSKLNVMLFAPDGSKAFSKVRTQLMSDNDFGTMSLSVSPGTYTVVAVGHSSAKSATIKSPTVCQFTASDGEKLTDTFCCCTTIEVREDVTQHNLLMNRATAMFRLVLTDADIPSNAVRMKFDYTGGSANFNPSTLEGITKSTQSESRIIEGNTFDIFTFPYYASDGLLKVTATALAADGSVISQRIFEGVEVTRNMVTIYKGEFFSNTGNLTQEGVGFHVNDDWAGETLIEY